MAVCAYGIHTESRITHRGKPQVKLSDLGMTAIALGAHILMREQMPVCASMGHMTSDAAFNPRGSMFKNKRPFFIRVTCQALSVLKGAELESL